MIIKNKRLLDLTGLTFGGITVLEYSFRKNKASYFKCLCICGNILNKSTQSLRKGKMPSCGCLHGAIVTENKTRHGLCNTRIYRIWRCMLNRCEYKGHDKYKNYGGKGITVCERWHLFDNFYADTKEGYADNLTINRIDNNLGYNKNNCNWKTMKEQCNHRSTSRYFSYNGETLTVSEWSDKLNIRHDLFRKRLSYGWDFNKIITTPVRIKK